MTEPIAIEFTGDCWNNPVRFQQQLDQHPPGEPLILDLCSEGPSLSAMGITKVIDACLIVHAEHTMNASTFSSRVTGSTLANPFTVVNSAIGTLAGPLHGGANEEVLDMLEEIGTAQKENHGFWASCL